MSEELKPCPFCGNDGSGPIEDALHVSLQELDWRPHAWSVQCDKCTATMGYSDSEDEAITAWNARASDAHIERIEALNAEAVSALRSIVEFCDDPEGSSKSETLAFGLARLLPAARAALSKAQQS